MRYKVAIDDGHGKDTPGKRTPYIASIGRRIHENEFNSACAYYLMEAVNRCGMTHVLTTTDGKDVSLKNRVKTSNDTRADVFVSIHYNAYKSKFNSISGIETWYHKLTSSGDKLAAYVQKELIKATGRTNRGIKPTEPENKFYVLKYTKAPAILVECGFMTNKAEALTMIEEDYQRTCAEAICEGICKFLKVDYVEPDNGSSKIEELKKENEAFKVRNTELLKENTRLSKNMAKQKEYLCKYLD